MLTAQPQAGRDSGKLALAVLRDTALLERGAKIRTLYQHSARRSTVTREYVAAVTERGAEVRTLDEFRSEEHTSELQSLMRISYAVFCLKKKKTRKKKAAKSTLLNNKTLKSNTTQTH